MEATILNKIGTFSTPTYITVDYEYDVSIAGTSGMVEVLDIELPSHTIERESQRNIPPPYTLTGKAYGILLNSFAISCNSRNYTTRIFNRYDADPNTYMNSIYEILYYSGLNLSKFDTTLGSLFILNKDPEIINKLYLHIINYDSIETGTITFSLTYQVIQDKEIVII